MPNVNAQFQGQTLIRPGAYYADDVSAVQSNTPPSTPPLVFLGYGYGVQPQVPVTFNSAQDLLNAVRGGPCSGYVPFLTSPSGQLNGAQQVTFINVGNNTQSSYTLSAGATGVINLTSANYGLPSNQLQVRVQTGTLAGKNVTIYDAYGNVSIPTGENLGVPFKLAYTGAATGVTYTVTVSGGAAITLSTLSPNAGESISLSLLPSNYATIEGVVNYLNNTGFYLAVTLSNGLLPSSNLDAASTVALASGGVSYANVTATLGDIVYWVNTAAVTLATAVIASGITSSTALAPTNIPFTLFTGATSTPPTTANYASGFNVALTVPGWAVFADSSDTAVIALGTQHAATASTPAVAKWRRFFTGSAVGDSVATVVAKAQSQNSITTTFVYPGIFRTNAASQNQLYGGIFAAAAAAGMATGNTIPTPLTNKSLTGNGVEVNLSDSDVNQLQQAGVMCLATSQQTGEPTIISDLTTWQSDSNPENVYNQQVACRWALAYNLVGILAAYVGTIASALTETNILNATKTSLNDAVYSSSNANGVINSWDPASLQIVYTGANQTASISVNVTLVGQNRFITIFVPIQPLNVTISANILGQSGNVLG